MHLLRSLTTYDNRTLATGVLSGVYAWVCLLATAQAPSAPAVLLLAAFFFFGYRLALSAPFKKWAACCFSLTGFIWFCLLGQLALSGTLPFGRGFFLAWLFVTVLGTPILYGYIFQLSKVCPSGSAPVEKPFKLWLCYTGILLLFWFPVFLCWGPVRLDVDSVGLLRQIFEGGLNDAHPIWYTLLLGLVLKPFAMLGQMELGAYCMGLLQMTAIAGILAYSLVWMRQKQTPNWLILLSIGLFCSTTMYAFHSLVLWKDPLFNGTLLAYSLCLFDIAQTKGALLNHRSGQVRICLLTLAVCMLRGNGWLICVVGTVGILLFHGVRKKAALTLLPLLLVIKLVTGPVYDGLGLSSPLTAEAWAIPLQQLGFVASNSPEAFTPAQQEQLSRVIPLEELAACYSPSSVDPIKRSPGFQLEYFGTGQGKRDLIGVWLELMPQNLGSYTKAWLMETALYTNPRFSTQSYSFPYEDSNGAYGIYSKDIVGYFTGSHWLRDELEARAQFFPPALLAYTVLALCILMGLKGQPHRILAFVPALLVWVGMVLGAPSYAEIRYMLIFAYGIPAFVWMAFAPNPSKEY
ncbi:MAG: hypothetical protein H9882_00060 [Candidatus Fournierella pullistercoris]|uniref:Uncharacterized protein n=1 Tax=Candidatus Allofournierella pullistercoris TaxID=2838597 RepID=A0A948SZD8_9FIRM|nr:hypothetical protein [Candidatus Fournierella pullistercoris]